MGEIPRLWLEGGQVNKLCDFLSDYDFIEAKVNHPQFGVHLLIEDYELVENIELSNHPKYNIELSNHPKYNAETLEDLKLIKQALRLSAHVLRQDTKQLAGQLAGRLLPFEQQTTIQKLLEKISQTEITCLRPLTASLTPPSHGLISTIKGHSDSVNAVAVTGDGKYAVSASDDETLKVWELATGKEIATFTGEDSIDCCAITPDGVTIAAGDESGKLHFLGLQGIEVQS